jgi:tRNA (guanine26-N2/guanine27-N2)-dimethyltransferase
MTERWKTVVEGKTKISVPADSLSLRVPRTHPVFFNPAARMNRDISVAIASVSAPQTYLDVLAATGARGLRIAKESGSDTKVTLVDFSRESLVIARQNVALNRLGRRCSVVHSEANAFLYSRFDRDEKFEAVDVDPFGTPAPYLQAALMASKDGSILSFTATDAAVLCGVYPHVALRRYGASTTRSEFVHETAIRILVAFAARLGGINDVGLRPVAAHSTLHYLRVYVRVSRSATAADESMKELGYVAQCGACWRRTSSGSPIATCPHCGAKVRAAGPMWVGQLCDDRLIEEAAKYCGSNGWTDSLATIGGTIGMGRFPPYSYSLERVTSRLGLASTPIDGVVENLLANGFRCMRQPFEEISVKTDADYADVERAVRGASA